MSDTTSSKDLLKKLPKLDEYLIHNPLPSLLDPVVSEHFRKMFSGIDKSTRPDKTSIVISTPRKPNNLLYEQLVKATPSLHTYGIHPFTPISRTENFFRDAEEKDFDEFIKRIVKDPTLSKRFIQGLVAETTIQEIFNEDPE